MLLPKYTKSRNEKLNRARDQLDSYISVLKKNLDAQNEKNEMLRREQRDVMEQDEFVNQIHSRNDTNMTLVLLCGDICQHICSYLTFRQICESMSRVCHLWREAAYSAVRTVSFVHDDDENYMNNEQWNGLFFQVLVKMCTRLTHFSIRIDQRIEVFQNLHLAAICDAWKDSLEDLVLVNCPFITQRNGWPLIGNHLTSLKRLHLSKVIYLTESNLIHMVQHIHKLEDFSVIYSPAVTDEVVRVLTENHKTLKTLDLKGSPIGDASLRHIGSNLDRLEYLNLLEIRGSLSDKGVIALSGLFNSLKTLIISLPYNKKNENENYMRLLEAWKVVQKYPVRLGRWMYYGLLMAVQEPTYDSVTDMGVLDLSQLTRIEYLTLNHFLTSSRSIRALSENLSFLKHLDLSDSSMVSCGGILQILSRFQSLKSLNVSHCANQFSCLCTDFMHFVDKDATALYHGEPDTSDNIDCDYYQNIKYFTSNNNHEQLVKLEALSIREANRFNASDLAFFLRLLGSELRVLDMGPGTDSDPEFLKSITESSLCPKLKFFSLGSNAVVTIRDVMGLLEKRPDIKDMFLLSPSLHAECMLRSKPLQEEYHNFFISKFEKLMSLRNDDLPTWSRIIQKYFPNERELLPKLQQYSC